jgi:hypothetical protein
MASIGSGWLVLTDGTDTLYLACKNVKWNLKIEGQTIRHYYGKSNSGYDLEKTYLEVRAQRVIMDDDGDFEDMIAWLLDWNADGPFALSIYKNSSSAKIKLDASNTDFEVLLSNPRNFEKIAPGDRQVYAAGILVFEQAGGAS